MMILSLLDPILWWLLHAWLLLSVLMGWRNVRKVPSLELQGSAHTSEGAAIRANHPKASVLIPARNEEYKLPILLESLCRQGGFHEILVLDDNSQDATAEVAKRFSPQVEVIQGSPLPAGWTGKNWACMQLAQRAKGDILIFCDADVTVSGPAVEFTVLTMEREQHDGFSCFPRQLYSGWYDRATLPLILHFPIAAWLPMDLVSKTPYPAISIAMGPWLCIRRKTYDAIGGHASVKEQVAEDLALARRIKKHGFKLGVGVTKELLSLRMYDSLSHMWEGFTKILHCLTGGRALLLLPLAFGYAAIHLAPFILPFLWGWEWAALPLLWLAARISAMRVFHGEAKELLWHPVGAVLAPLLALGSAYKAVTGTLRWKGRSILKGDSNWDSTHQVVPEQRKST